MKRYLQLLLLCIVLVCSSCSSTTKSMKNPLSYVELERGDFDLSEQKTAKAKQKERRGSDGFIADARRKTHPKTIVLATNRVPMARILSQDEATSLRNLSKRLPALCDTILRPFSYLFSRFHL